MTNKEFIEKNLERNNLNTEEYNKLNHIAGIEIFNAYHNDPNHIQNKAIGYINIIFNLNVQKYLSRECPFPKKLQQHYKNIKKHILQESSHHSDTVVIATSKNVTSEEKQYVDLVEEKLGLTKTKRKEFFRGKILKTHGKKCLSNNYNVTDNIYFVGGLLRANAKIEMTENSFAILSDVLSKNTCHNLYLRILDFLITKRNYKKEMAIKIMKKFLDPR